MTTAPGVSDLSLTTNSASANANILRNQWVSAPLGEGVTRGTITGQCLAQELTSAGDYCIQFVARIFSSDGSTERGVVYAADNSAITNSFDTATPTNRGMPRGSSNNPLTVNPVTYIIGDILVIEIGFRNFTGTNNQVRYFATNNNASDLPRDETTTVHNNTWIEFSQDLFFVFNATPVGHPAGGFGRAKGQDWRGRRKSGWL